MNYYTVVKQNKSALSGTASESHGAKYANYKKATWRGEKHFSKMCLSPNYLNINDLQLYPFHRK